MHRSLVRMLLVMVAIIGITVTLGTLGMTVAATVASVAIPVATPFLLYQASRNV